MLSQKLASPQNEGRESPVAAAESRAKDGPRHRDSLLIVDDSELNRDLLSRRLRHLGYEVTVVDSGPKALEQIASRSFDAALLDVMMPGMSGLQVLEEARRTHSAADLPIIMATALDQSDDVVRALRLGANDYVSKPFDFEVVFARLRTQISLKQAKARVDRLVEELEVRSRFIQKTFGRYLSDEIVTSLLDSKDGLRLGGERREVILLMSDLRGFTPLTEGMPPEQVMTLLNNYLGAMARIITEKGGMIDEFIGDGILAVFGVPNQGDDDAHRAAACALSMQLAMSAVNEKNLAERLPALEMGIAVHAGCVVVGNIGSEARAKYGVVGSHVNLTSRIESCTVGGQVLISGAALDILGPSARLGKQTAIHAKGFKELIVVHELLGLGDDLSLPEQKEEPRRLHDAIPVMLSSLTDKQIDGGAIEGTITALSPSGCEIRSTLRPAPLCNLRLCLGEDPDAGEIYGKVVSAGEVVPDRFCLRFTSIDAAMTRRLGAIAGGAP